MSTAEPTFLPLPSLCCGLWSPVCLPISLIIPSYMYMVSWQAPIRRLMFPSSVWAQRCITFVTCCWQDGMYGSEQLLWLHVSLALSPTSDLCPSIFYHFLNLYPYVVAPHQYPIFATWAERMVVISRNATPIDFYVASLERPRKNFLVRSLSLNISSPACIWLLGGSVACSGEVGQGPVN